MVGGHHYGKFLTAFLSLGEKIAMTGVQTVKNAEHHASFEFFFFHSYHCRMIHHSPKAQPLFTDSGIVMGGSNIAQVLGFPTANICLTNPELAGTYAGEVLIDSRRYKAAVYADPVRELLESHILDFVADLYGKEITVILYKHVAPIEKYPNDEATRQGIAQAVAKVKEYFKKGNTN